MKEFRFAENRTNPILILLEQLKNKQEGKRMDILEKVFEERTLIWALISFIFGLLIEFFTRGVEFLFANVIGPTYLRKREARRMLKRYSCPLLQAADSLERRIENMISFIDEDWFNNSDDDYYRLSTLYVFGRYFGWCKAIEDETFLEFELSDMEEKRFMRHFYRVFKAINSFYYFENSIWNEMSDIDSATVPRFALTAMGELMIQRSDEKGGKSLSVIGFVDFAEKYRGNDEKFRKWFSYLENVLSKVEKDKSKPGWNRLIMLAIALRLMILYLDPKNRLTAPRRTYYLQYLHPEVQERVCAELEKAGYTDVIR
ncbi:MAG: hypothetical protein WBA22_07470 [Candidatus Methanofastidiosia archaeon]